MDCVVTGGAGFIGSNLVDALIARGDRVTVIDDLSTGKRENLAAGDRSAARMLEVVDVRERRRVGAVFDRRAPRGRLPPGGPDRRPRLGRGPGRRRHRQRAGDDRRAGGRARGRRAPASSTPRRRRPVRRRRAAADARGLPDPRRWRPTGRASTPPRATAALYTRLHGLSTVSLRYGNVYGPRQDVHGEAGVVAIFCGQLIDGRSAEACSATGARRAIGSTSPTSSPPTCWPPIPS